MLIFQSLEMILLRTASDLSQLSMVGSNIVRKTVSTHMKLILSSLHSENHRYFLGKSSADICIYLMVMYLWVNIFIVWYDVLKWKQAKWNIWNVLCFVYLLFWTGLSASVCVSCPQWCLRVRRLRGMSLVKYTSVKVSSASHGEETKL